jgi:hypothetical protein
MPCIILKKGKNERRIPPDPDGQFRYIPQPGEKFDGSIDPNCGGEIAMAPVTDEAEFLLAEIEAELATEGQGLGDWIGYLAAPVAIVIGKKNCMSCEVRKAALNALAKLAEKYGKKKAKKMVKRLLLKSLWKKPDEIARELKKYLNA